MSGWRSTDREAFASTILAAMSCPFNNFTRIPAIRQFQIRRCKNATWLPLAISTAHKSCEPIMSLNKFERFSPPSSGPTAKPGSGRGISGNDNRGFLQRLRGAKWNTEQRHWQRQWCTCGQILQEWIRQKILPKCFMVGTIFNGSG